MLLVSHYIFAFFSGLDGGESIFEMMKLAEVPITNQTKFSLSRGLIINGNLEELKTAFTKYQIVLDEESFLKATEDLALNDRYLWLPEVCIFSFFHINL